MVMASGLATWRDGFPRPTQTQARLHPPPFLPVCMLASDCRSGGLGRLRAELLSLLRMGPSREPGRPQLDSSCVGRRKGPTFEICFSELTLEELRSWAKPGTLE